MVRYVFLYTATFLNLEACEKNKEEESLVDRRSADGTCPCHPADGAGGERILMHLQYIQ